MYLICSVDYFCSYWFFYRRDWISLWVVASYFYNWYLADTI